MEEETNMCNTIFIIQSLCHFECVEIFYMYLNNNLFYLSSSIFYDKLFLRYMLLVMFSKTL